MRKPETTGRSGSVLAVAVAGLLVFASSAAAESRIADAVQRRDWSAVTKLLEQRIDVNAPQPDGATPLAWAAHWDALEIADRLLTAGANANLANELGVTPLMLASVNGSSAMIERLLKAGAQPNTARPSGETAMMLAARAGSAASVKLLAAHGADPNSKTKTGDTALMFAAAERHPGRGARTPRGRRRRQRPRAGGREGRRRQRVRGAPDAAARRRDAGRRPAEAALQRTGGCRRAAAEGGRRRTAAARGRVHAAAPCRDVRRSGIGEDAPRERRRHQPDGGRRDDAAHRVDREVQRRGGAAPHREGRERQR